MMYNSTNNFNHTLPTREATLVSSGDDRVVVACQNYCSFNNPLFSTPSPNNNQQIKQQELLEPQQKTKKKRSLPGNPDPDAEVIALSPRTLLATNRFVCEICNKGFQRDQNLQLHRRGHNLPWKLKQRNNKLEGVKKRAYVCPDPSCVHHHPSRALGDLTGVKKHYSRKHGVKKWKCGKCDKVYAVHSDWKAHTKVCGTREYRCDCGILFSRKDSFISHRAFCDALAEESARVLLLSTRQHRLLLSSSTNHHHHNYSPLFTNWDPLHHQNPNTLQTHPLNVRTHNNTYDMQTYQHQNHLDELQHQPPPTTLEAPVKSALLQKAANLGALVGQVQAQNSLNVVCTISTGQENDDGLTRDFLGLTGKGSNDIRSGGGGGHDVNITVDARGMLRYTRGVGHHSHHQQPLQLGETVRMLRTYEG